MLALCDLICTWLFGGRCGHHMWWLCVMYLYFGAKKSGVKWAFFNRPANGVKLESSLQSYAHDSDFLWKSCFRRNVAAIYGSRCVCYPPSYEFIAYSCLFMYIIMYFYSSQFLNLFTHHTHKIYNHFHIHEYLINHSPYLLHVLRKRLISCCLYLSTTLFYLKL